MRISTVIFLGFVSFIFTPFAFGNSSDQNEASCDNTFGDGEQSTTDSNPFLSPSSLPHNAFPFDRLKPEHFAPAIDAGIAEAESNLAALLSLDKDPTFSNTILALENITTSLDRVWGIFHLLLPIMNTDGVLTPIHDHFRPLIVILSSKIFSNQILFARVKTLYDRRDELHLQTADLRLLETTYRSFIRNGAHLDAAEISAINDITIQISVLGRAFDDQLEADTVKNVVIASSLEELSGLPENAIEIAKADAAANGHEGKWLLSTRTSSYITAMSYINSRELREKLWRTERKVGGTKNIERLLQILKLRQQRAGILGYKTFAHSALEDRMAKSPESVQQFLEDIGAQYKAAAIKELEDLTLFAKANGFPDEQLKPWDVSYYMTMLRKQKYDFDLESLRPYFQYDDVLAGLFSTAEKLFGVKFTKAKSLPTWDEKVDAFEVHRTNGEFVGLFYSDNFPRQNTRKEEGAWSNEFLPGGKINGRWRSPEVINVGNYTPSVNGKPALLSLNDVTTMFHELGHAMHGLLSRAEHQSQFGTAVATDFVELPSQLFENWVLLPEVLALFAKHFETGEPIPAELVSKAFQSKNFFAAYTGLRQITLGVLDITLHSNPEALQLATPENYPEIEADLLAHLRLIPAISGVSIASTFSHIFASSYAAGYYSYKWSEVLAADAWELFKEEGVFSAELAERYVRTILERGGSEDEADMYRNFRGRDPDPRALLREQGL